MSAPAAAAKDLNDGADLGLIEGSDRHCLHGRDEAEAGAGDEGGRDNNVGPDREKEHSRDDYAQITGTRRPCVPT